ncbi:MAG: response regulator [Planctomycetota bacterium]
MVAERKVLIVEDEHIIQAHLRMALDELGYTVTGTAATATEALRSARNDAPHLVLMDVKLAAGDDGIEVARELRKRYDPALVFLTAFGDATTIARAQEVGANGYLVKPFTKPQIRATVSTAFSEHQRMRQVRESQRALASAVAGAGDAVIVTDVDGFVTFLDQKAVQLTGWSQSEALDRHVLDIVRLRSLQSLLAQALCTREPATAHAPVAATLIAHSGAELEIEWQLKDLTDTDDSRRGMVLLLRERNAREPARVHAAPSAARRFGAGTRMAIFSHDTVGLGHLRRCTNIAQALTTAYPGLSALMLTGSPAVHRYTLPQGVDYIKLPAVRKVAAEQYTSRTLGLSGDGVLKLRSNLVLHTLQDFRPDVLLVDHAPLGMKGELLATLEWLARHQPGCIKLLGLRDIIDDAPYVKSLWREQDMYGLLRRFYDHILVYGCQDVYDTVREYDFPPDLIARTTFCHYVQEQPSPQLDAEAAAIATGGKPLVVVTIGGGDGGEALISTHLAMLRRHAAEVDFATIVLTGPFLSAELQARFAEASAGLPVQLVEFVTSTSAYLARADLIVSTCGYNTMTQTLALGRKALVVPRVMHRQEQLVRARRLAELGLIEFAHPDALDPEQLYRSVRRLLDDEAQPIRAARQQRRIELDGTDQVARLCGQLTLA